LIRNPAIFLSGAALSPALSLKVKGEGVSRKCRRRVSLSLWERDKGRGKSLRNLT